MTRRCSLLVLSLLLAPASGLFAAANVAVVSREPVTVFLDAEDVGTAPLTLRAIAPGKHHIRVISRATGASRSYDIVSPRKVTSDQTIEVEFLGDPRRQVVERPVVVERPLVVEEPVVVRRPVVYESPVVLYGPSYYGPSYYRHHYHRW